MKPVNGRSDWLARERFSAFRRQNQSRFIDDTSQISRQPGLLPLTFVYTNYCRQQSQSIAVKTDRKFEELTELQSVSNSGVSCTKALDCLVSTPTFELGALSRGSPNNCCVYVTNLLLSQYSLSSVYSRLPCQLIINGRLLPLLQGSPYSLRGKLPCLAPVL